MREIMLIIHFIGLTMGLGTSFAHAYLGLATSKMTADDAMKFQLHALVLSKMGYVGLVLLIISGFYLLTPYWATLSSSPFLILKLILVLILLILISTIGLLSKKAKRGNAREQLQKMEWLGKLTLIVGLAIVILSVYIFH